VIETVHWGGRYKTEEIMEVGCPKCGARPHEFCARRGSTLTPRSHQERMWLRQGHDPKEFARLRARVRPGSYRKPSRRLPPAGGSRDYRLRCDCGLIAMPIRGVTRGGRDFTGWGCPAWACGYRRLAD
jgi:hypothetical protein